MRRLGLLLGLLALTGCAPRGDDPLAREVGGLRGALLVPVSGGYVRNGVGTTARLKDGRLFHLVTRHRKKAGVSIDHWPSDIVVITSGDDGRTWTRPRILFHGPGPSAAQPGLVRMKSGELGVSYSRITDGAVADKVFRWSTDEGKTWSDPVPVCPPVAYCTSAHDRLTVLATGRLVIPLHVKLSVNPEQIVTRVARSDDNGRSWKVSDQTINVPVMIPGYRAPRDMSVLPSFGESSIVERLDGSLLMLGRTLAGGLYATTSTDGGEHWTTPVPTSLITGASPGNVVRLPGPDGTLMVIWNRCCLGTESAQFGRRLPLSSAVSHDGGLTWGGIRDLEAIAPVGRVEYPAILISNGKAYITYRVLGRSLPPAGSQEYLTVLPVDWFDVEAVFHQPRAVATAR
ncbi:MAG: sialidase family protein [Caulobacter sp.]